VAVVIILALARPQEILQPITEAAVVPELTQIQVQAEAVIKVL
jgi:hypothetical protein